MPFNAACSKLPPNALVIALTSLSACATGGSDLDRVAVCPQVVEYDQTFRQRAAAELELLPQGSAMEAMLTDYYMIRAYAKSCMN